MADAIPSPYVDARTGEIRRFQTLPEKITGEYLPEAGHIGILGVKLAMLAPFVGGLVIAAPAALGFWALSRLVVTKAVDLMHEKLLLKHKQGDFIEFDFNDPKDRAAFNMRFGREHPTFIDEYLHLAKAAKLEQVPKVFVIDQFFKKEGRATLGGLVSDYMAGTTTRPSGKDPVIMLGKGALKDLDAGELRAVVAHEMTHVALGHPKNGVKWMARMPLNTIINTSLIIAAIAGPLPLLPVLGVVAASNVVGRALKSIKSRHQEEMCDRGAALMTGGCDDLTSALAKIRDAMVKMKRIETEYQYRSQGLEPPAPQQPSRWNRFVNASHPSNERRDSLLKAFEQDNSAYVAQKKGFFATQFNRAADRMKPAITKFVSGLTGPGNGFTAGA
ncbi:MAG TPA: M48 family metalloprotease [Patescibacteria group bacterium]|nr:M48 family metalloprotease [Patescibacteria group bacterium]